MVSTILRIPGLRTWRRGALVFLAALLPACASAAPADTALAKSAPSAAPPGCDLSEGERCASDPLPPGVVPFHAPMTPPNPSTLPPLEATPEVIEANATGRIRVSCIITKEGEAKQCLFRETMPTMSDVALAAIAAQRFEPAKLGEEPMAVEYDFVWDYPPKAEVPKVEAPEGELPKGEPYKGAFTPYFGKGMKRPQKISGPSIGYTRDALRHRVRGVMIARCVITAEGKVEGCRLIKTLPFMGEAVVGALEASRYTPAKVDEVPQQVWYTFTIRLWGPFW